MSLRARLLGSWHLVHSSFGHAEDGLLMYDGNGCVSAQIMRRHQPHFANDDFRVATNEEKAAAWSEYFAYFGTFTVDEEARTITHHVEGSSFPNLVNTSQERHCELRGNRLTLSAETAWGVVTIVWERARPSRSKGNCEPVHE